MKTLSPSQLAELIPATPDQLKDGLARFEVTAPILCREPGYIKKCVDEGFIETSTVKVKGKDSWLIGWHISPDNGLWFDFVVTLNSGANWRQCADAVEKMARARSCRYIRWVTMRRGIVEWAKQSGYEAEAVILTKKL